MLKAQNPTEIDGGNLAPIAVPKKWGEELWIATNNNFALKRISIEPNKSFSRQFHIWKSEVQWVLLGSGRLELGRDAGIVHNLRVGDTVNIEPGVIHKLIAGPEGITIIEASTPELTDVVHVEEDRDPDNTRDLTATNYSEDITR